MLVGELIMNILNVKHFYIFVLVGYIINFYNQQSMLIFLYKNLNYNNFNKYKNRNADAMGNFIQKYTAVFLLYKNAK